MIGVLKNKCITSNLLNSEMQKATVVMKKKFFSTSFFFIKLKCIVLQRYFGYVDILCLQ